MKNIVNHMRLSKYNLTQTQVEILNSIEYTNDEFEKLKRMIRSFLKNSLLLEPLRDNWPELSKLNRDSSSLKSFQLRYGEEDGYYRFLEKTKKTILTKERMVQKYGEEYATDFFKKRGACLETYINKHGEEKGRAKWGQYCDKRRASFEKGKQEGKYASRNLEWFKAKYGDETGYAIWDKKRKDQAYHVSKEYYIQQYGYEEGTERIKKMKTRDLPFFIEKYGLEEGTVRYNNKILNSTRNRKRISYSKWSHDLCMLIKQEIKDLEFFGDNERAIIVTEEYRHSMNKRCVFPDLVYNNRIIEFQGDNMHGNPNRFNDTDTPHPFEPETTASELRNKDKLRYEFLESIDFEVLEIWESEFKYNKAQTTEKCICFLTK